MRVVRLHQKRFASLVEEIFIFSLKYGMAKKNGHPETSRERHRDANGKLTETHRDARRDRRSKTAFCRIVQKDR